MQLDEEQKRLCETYVKYLPQVIFCGHKGHPVTSHSKVTFLQQIYTSAPRSKKGNKKTDVPVNTFFLSFKSGFFSDLCSPHSRVSLGQTDSIVSWFYLEQACTTKDHLLHLLSFFVCALKRGGYLIGTCFDAIQVLLAFAQDVDAKCIQIPRDTFEKCQLNLLDGKKNASVLASLKIPMGSEFHMKDVEQEDKKKLPERCVLFDWKTMEKQIIRFGFRLVETQVFSPFSSISFPLCRSFVFQMVENRVLEYE